MEMEKMKDDIDFSSMKVSHLFVKLFVPTLLGMISSAVFIITDGIFVGKGIGSNALAAVNITAPLSLISTGIALMFGIGASVVASIHLSHGKLKSARINITQSLAASALIIAVYSAILLWDIDSTAYSLGCTEHLLPLATEYMKWFVPFLIFCTTLSTGMFFIRLDGSPNYAMMCNIIPAVINIILDYVFIFIFQWGMFGAALATSLGYIAGAMMIILYLSSSRHAVRFIRIKASMKSMMLTLRNIGYMCRLGVSSFLCETAIAAIMFIGNATFIKYLGEDGVAAYSVACYLLPIIFMVYNAVAQSAQPILSYNYGIGDKERIRTAFRISMSTAIACGATVFVAFILFGGNIVAMFLTPGTQAYKIAVEGLPLFGCGFIFFGINIVLTGYLQSMERDIPAMCITILRGYVLTAICFTLLPAIWGRYGIWLSVPASEAITFMSASAFFMVSRMWKKHARIS